jgi:hypothetical protein
MTHFANDDRASRRKDRFLTCALNIVTFGLLALMQYTLTRM